MVERQDIDALLIGALYGELTPAEEKQLSAHLESHPTDRSALEGLTRARAALHESRILAVQVDPPPSISALLMQEAARRAPKADAEGEGWFARFVRSFVQHPAMAAAAMLVLVVGFAALVGRNQGSMSVEQTVASESSVTAPAQDTAPGAPGAAPAMGDEQFTMQPRAAVAPAGEGGAGGDADQVNGTGADQGRLDSRLQNAESYKVDLAKAPEPPLEEQAQRDAKPAVKEYADGVVVTRKAPAPKDLEPAAKPKGTSARGAAPAPSVESEATPRQEMAFGGAAPPPPPAPPATTAPAKTTAKPEPATGKKMEAADALAVRDAPADKNAAESKSDVDTVWARQQHQTLLAAVKAGDCARAANLAVSIEQRAPGYYASNVATDRATKDCRAYIAQKREAAEASRLKARALEEGSATSSKAAKAAPKKAAPPPKAKASDKAATESVK